MKYTKIIQILAIQLSITSAVSYCSFTKERDDKKITKCAEYITKETGQTYLLPSYVPEMPSAFACGSWTQYTVHNKKDRKTVSYRKAIDPLCIDPNNCFMYISGHPKNIANIVDSNITREKYNEIETQYRALVLLVPKVKIKRRSIKERDEIQLGAAAPVEGAK